MSAFSRATCIAIAAPAFAAPLPSSGDTRVVVDVIAHVALQVRGP